MIAFLLAFTDISTVKEAGRVTLSDYALYRKAYDLKQLEAEYQLHLQAFLNRAVKATDSSGKKYKYRKFSDFYDYQTRADKLLGRKKDKPVFKELMERAKRVQEYQKRKEGDG